MCGEEGVRKRGREREEEKKKKEREWKRDGERSR
jgi:hypothetical protein